MGIRHGGRKEAALQISGRIRRAGRDRGKESAVALLVVPADRHRYAERKPQPFAQSQRIGIERRFGGARS
jgi:hypothetical protein